MKILKGILNESKEYYEKQEREIIKELSKLPKGSIKKRKLGRRYYYYLQNRKGKKIIHKYLGKSKPQEIIDKVKRRKVLEKELRKIKASIKLLSRMK